LPELHFQHHPLAIGFSLCSLLGALFILSFSLRRTTLVHALAELLSVERDAAGNLAGQVGPVVDVVVVHAQIQAVKKFAG